MPLTFQFPEGPRLRRLAASLATPARRSNKSPLSQRTYAFFLAFPWTGRRETNRHTLDLKSASVGQWFDQFPWNGVLLVPGGMEQAMESPPREVHGGRDQTARSEPRTTSERETSSFFDAFFGDDAT